MPNGFEMARLVITCCAADARPVIVSVRTQGPTPSRDAWVTVTGEYGGMSPSDYTVPVLRALNVTPTRQPDNPYDRPSDRGDRISPSSRVHEGLRPRHWPYARSRELFRWH